MRELTKKEIESNFTNGYWTTLATLQDVWEYLLCPDKGKEYCLGCRSRIVNELPCHYGWSLEVIPTIAMELIKSRLVESFERDPKDFRFSGFEMLSARLFKHTLCAIEDTPPEYKKALDLILLRMIETRKQDEKENDRE